MMLRSPRSFRGGDGFDPDATSYFARIVTAGSTINEANKNAVNAFVVGCKADGIWSAIKASCILAGANTLAGALVPLVGTAPTNEGPFVEDDYSRTTGLLGDGSSKYLNPNFSVTSDYQNNVHCAVWRSTAEGSVTQALFGNTNFGGGLQAVVTSSQRGYRVNDFAPLIADTSRATGFLGVARIKSSESIYRYNSNTQSQTQASTDTVTTGMTIFARNGVNLTIARMSFYSIGESLNLALLDARLTTLMDALT